MRIHYEEKTFEAYFNAELSHRGVFYFPPGQVQEGSMGADAIAMCRNRWLWRRLGHPYLFSTPFSGAPYREMAEEMERYLDQEITDVPDVQGNIFFQFKRSERMISKTAEEWVHWNQSYFRYDIYQEQHLLLEHLHQKFGAEVLILYAAPAVQDVNELVDLHKTRRIIRQTNFRPAHELSGHRRNTFVEPGNHSWACSEPVRLEPFNFEDALTRFKFAQTPSRQLVVGISNSVEEVLRGGSYREPFDTLSGIYGLHELSQRAPLLKAYTTMAILRELTGIQWVVVHRHDA